MTFCTIAFCWRLQNFYMELSIVWIWSHAYKPIQNEYYKALTFLIIVDFVHVNQLSIRIICIIDFVHEITILYIWLIYSRYGVKHQNNRSIVYVTHDSLPLFKFVVFDHECLLFDVCCFWTWIFVICWLLFLNMNICYFLIIVFKHKSLFFCWLCFLLFTISLNMYFITNQSWLALSNTRKEFV